MTSTSPRTLPRRAGLVAVLAAGGALTVAAVAGCGGGQQNSASAPTTSAPAAAAPVTGGAPVATAPDTATSAATDGGAAKGGSSSTAHTGGTPECKSTGLKLSFGGSDAGMSQQEQVLRFTNTGSATCAIVGYPGVSFVTGDNGQQVGAGAVRTGKIGAQVNLPPGGVASTVLHTVDPGAFDASACKPVPVRGYRIYPPDETASLFIALPAQTTACSGTTPDSQLTVSTIKLGPGDPDQP